MGNFFVPMQLPEICLTEKFRYNIMCFKSREILIQIMARNISENILGIDYEENPTASYMIPWFSVKFSQHLNICL